MSRINEKLGLRPAGARARLQGLSGVRCPVCPHTDTISHVVQRRLTWMCGWCGHLWEPATAELAAYNGRVRPSDRIGSA